MMSTVTFHPFSKHTNCPLPCYAHLLWFWNRTYWYEYDASFSWTCLIMNTCCTIHTFKELLSIIQFSYLWIWYMYDTSFSWICLILNTYKFYVIQTFKELLPIIQCSYFSSYQMHWNWNNWPQYLMVSRYDRKMTEKLVW